MNLHDEKIEDLAKDIKSEMSLIDRWDALYDFFEIMPFP